MRPAPQRKEVHLFIEGGGDDSNGRNRLRQGFSALFEPLKRRSSRSVVWRFVMCGATSETYKEFRDERERRTGLCILLVDADGEPQGTVWEHLRTKHRCEAAGPEECCHLMVQTMEAWLLCDLDAVADYYSKGFDRDCLPRPEQVERASKDKLEQALKKATKGTKKGTYHKIWHAADLLQRISFEQVKKHSASFRRLVDTLDNYI